MVQSILWKIKSLYLIYVCLFADRKTNVSTHSLTSAFISYSATESVVHFPGPVSLGFDHKKFYSVAFLPMSIFISNKCYNASTPFLPVRLCWFYNSASAHLVSILHTCSLKWTAFLLSTHTSQVVFFSDAHFFPHSHFIYTVDKRLSWSMKHQVWFCFESVQGIY